MANLPYNVAVPVLLHLLEVSDSLRHGLVMVQAEVADRLAAPPGSRTYGVPSAKAAWYAEVRRAGPIGRNVFWPAPNVDSGLVAFERREPPVTSATREEVFAVIEAAFCSGARPSGPPWPAGCRTATAWTRCSAVPGSTPKLRGEMLGITEFAAIAGAARPDKALACASATFC